MASEEAARIIDLYQRKALDWIESRARASLFEKPWLDRFRALLPPAAPILDIGCGSAAANGRLSDRAWSSRRRRGFISGHDRRLPKAFSAAGMDRRRYAQACLAAEVFRHPGVGQFLSPLPRRSTPDVSGVSRACGAGAALMFTSGPAHGEAIGSFAGEPLYHASLDPAEYRSLLDRNGFRRGVACR